MIRCVSCIPNYNSPYLYKVKLISNSKPKELPVNGKNVIGLTNLALFENGSELLICVNGEMSKYVYTENGFVPINEKIETTANGSLIIDDDGTVYIN